MIVKIFVKRQTLCLLDNHSIVKQWAISTSKYGIGNKFGSYKTPLGKHRIASKLGRSACFGAIFKKRRNTGKIAMIGKNRGDLITTRILRLEGLQKGINKGKDIDSFKRCIYIHGTPEETLIGKPASHGCIRMKNHDIIQLFDLVKKGMLVEITEM
jgi:hypothetical protein